MTASEQEAHVAPNPRNEMDDPPGGVIEIPLTASASGTTITISGNGDATLAKNRGATAFKFTLTDNSTANVKFASLDTADNISTCPTTGSGNGSTQIGGIGMNNNVSPKKAHFTDNNSNNAQNGPMNVSYQWNFTCDSGFTVGAFDPVISNGGKDGPIF